MGLLRVEFGVYMVFHVEVALFEFWVTLVYCGLRLIDLFGLELWIRSWLMF